ncbi:right-handed parallel beta-helix repeat-containing protein [Kitasatospora purpeofusca]|uniref:right-handed parallel beta-helix repeat-containing protein n=1 Tax=Kitasatospora purpeofusca TaxID=67352 RepID=UPI0007C56603|nr:right-handed parallel beta-helix repeat-containing protein [Kitasatospora purpeofusca]
MSRTRTALAAGLTLVATVGLPAVTTGGASAAAGSLYVDHAPGANCSNSGSGTKAQPFCTVAAAAAVASAGQTVEIAWGTYNEDLVITRSGRQGAPVVFRGRPRDDAPQNAAMIGNIETPSKGITVRGAEFVEFENLVVLNGGRTPSVTVEGAKQVKFTAVAADGALRITNGSRQVTFARGSLNGGYGMPAITVDGGSTGTVLTTNSVSTGNQGRPSVLVDGAPGTVVVSNSIYAECVVGIALDGASAGAVVENNVIDTARAQSGRCADIAAATGIVVAPTATAGTVVDYNVVDPRSEAAPYRWADTEYPSRPAFTAATGQGAHDFVAKVHEPHSLDGPQSASVDSADETAPGMLPVDRTGTGPADDPTVRNTGTGKGYRDRGATESRDFGSVFTPAGPVRLLDTREAVGVPGTEAVPAFGQVDLKVAGVAGIPASGVTAVTMNVTVTGPTEDGHLRVYPHGEERPDTSNLNWTAGRTLANQVNVPVKDGKVSFYNHSGGTVHVIADLAGYYGAQGDLFHPLSPSRLLDTREAVGVPGTEAVPAGGTVDLQVAGLAGAPLDGVTAVTMNVTMTDPTEDGHLRVYPHGTALPQTSSLNWTAGRTVPNLVTVPVKDGKVSFYNSSGGTVHVIADLAGYYSAEGRLTFTPVGPWRAMDTRRDVSTGCCVRPAGTVGAFDALDVEIYVPNIAAATLNVTVTEPGTDGHLIVYPGDEFMPAVSNLNFQAGETVANQVVVKVNAAHITIRNASAAPVHIVVDIFGTQSY